jgi:dTDP-4-dehydrorhamnose reductase
MGSGKVSILGGRGMLGSDVVLACEDKYDLSILDLPEFDITDYGQLEQVVRGSSVIVNCAAYTDVDGAETNADLAYAVNNEAVGRLGALAKAADVWVLHVSTDFVFDGRLDRPYVETDKPNPINTYGRSKLAGEQLLVESGCRHCIMRVEWTYGVHGSNFVSKIMELAKSRRQLRVVDDQIGSPTATTEVAGTIAALLEQQPQGVFHYAGSGYVSRFGLARFIAQKLRMDVEVLPCRSGDFARPADRPLNSRFDCSKIGALLTEPIRPWQEPLEEFLKKL